MRLNAEQEQLVHYNLHNLGVSTVMLNGEKVPIQIGVGNKHFLQYGTTTYEVATYNSPGKAGKLVRDNSQVTICVTTGQPWRLIVNGKEEGF